MEMGLNPFTLIVGLLRLGVVYDVADQEIHMRCCRYGTAGFADGECLFLPRVGMLPSACDTSFWRSDGEIGQICYIRYYAGPNLGGHYRLYAKSWNEESEFFVYDDSSGLYLCPAGFSDLYSMESCKKI